MESLLPTEIARLVYGYLMEGDCESAARLFLETSEHLKECLLVSKKGRRFNTRVSGHNLVDILDILCEATCIVKAYSENPPSKDTAENVLQQLKTLLIPEEIRKVRFMKGRNERSLPAIGINEEYNQNDMTKIRNTEKENAVSDNKLKPLLDNSFSPCENVTFNNDNIEEKKTCNNNVERTGVPTSLKIFDAMKNISDALVHHQASVKVCEKKEHFSDKMIQERSSESITSSVLQIESSQVDSSYLSVHCSENVSKSDYDSEKLEMDNINNSKTDATKNDITSSSRSTISKNAIPMLPPLPISIQQVSNPKSPVGANSLRMQLKTPSKLNLSFNQSEPIQDNDHLVNLQQTLTTSYSINQPLIYIKTGTIDKNQFRPNIFTSEHRPKSPSFREILENSSSSNEKNNQGSLEEKGSHSVETALKNNENSLNDASEIIRTGVRTRGGYRKRGGKVQRTVKAHLPKTVTSKENKPHLVPGIRENCDAHPSPSIIGMTVTNSENSSINPSSEKIVDETKTEENISIRKETVEKEIEEVKKKSTKDTAETPSIRNYRKRGSSSVPRRGSHIRALEFKTPMKNLLNRRSLTSPKQLQSSRSPATKKSLRCVRVTLFKSPSNKKENKAWDADLRKCFDDNTDIPSSVGLKRKSNTEAIKGESPDQTKSSTLSSKTPSELISPSSQLPSESPALRNEDTNDVLADKIQKEVLSVIGEEDMNFTGENTNLTNGLNKILFRGTNMCSTPNKSKSDILQESVNSVKKKYLNEGEIMNDNPKSPEFARLNNVMDVELTPNRSCFMTPVTKALQEHREILAHGLLTPGTPLTDINTPSTENKTKHFEGSSLKVVSSSSNLTCQDSLEASLIKECKRIETENLHNSTEQFVPSGEESSFNTPEKLIKRSDCEFKLNVLSSNDTPLRKSPSICYCSKQKNKKNEKIKTCGCDLRLNLSETTPDPENNSDDFQDVHNDNIHESTPVRYDSTQNRSLVSNENSKKNSIGGNNSFTEVEVFGNETCSDSKKQKDNHQQPNQVLEQSIKKIPTINPPTAAIVENVTFPESYKISTDKKTKTSLENLKSKKCPQKYEIDCSKLIAQCLQSAKENLYGVNKKMSSSHESLIQKITRERNVKLSKVKNVGNTPSEKRNRSSLRNKSSRALPARIKGKINSLLFSESESTSSCEDSFVSEIKDEKCGNKNSNENEDALSKVGLVNQIINYSSQQNSVTDADSVDFDDVFVTKNKQNMLGSNETNLEESSIKQKENIQKHLKKKTGNNLGEKLLAEQDVENETSLDHHVEVGGLEDIMDRPLDSNNGRCSVGSSSGNVNCPTLNKESMNNLPSMESFSESKENIEESPPKPPLVANNHKFSETLSNYTFTFALKLDGVNVTKQLSVSPFYSVMEMESTDENSSISNHLETTERDCCTLSVSDSEKKNKKRRRDHHPEKDFSEILSNSLLEDQKSSPVKKSKRSNDYRYSDLFCTRSERVKSRRYLESRIKRSPIRYSKNTYNRHFREYNTSRLRRYTSHSRFSHSEGSNPRRGVGGSSRKERYRNDESSKRSSYRTMESSENSRRFHKDRSEAMKSREDLKTRNQFKKDSVNSKTPSHYSSRSLKDKKKQTHGLDKEDGELSESSLSIYSSRPVEISSPTNNQRRITMQSSSSPVDEDTRAKLKKLNLDHFLSILHGKEK